MSVFKLKDGRSAFWQWDTGCKVVLRVPACRSVHFHSGADENALICPVYEQDGEHLANVPDVLLQTAGQLRIYAYVTDEAGGRTVLSEVFLVQPRPKPQDYIYTETESWSVEKAVADALEQAKQSGDFKGEPGPKGDPGAVKFVVVTQLPEQDSENAIYLLPCQDGGEENRFDEYIFVDGKWEKIGSAAVTVDLDAYLRRTEAQENFIARPATYPQLSGCYAINIDTGATQVIRYSPDPESYSLAYRGDQGVLEVGTPTASRHATTKAYVDGRITANEDGSLTVLLADGSKYKVNATKEEA